MSNECIRAIVVPPLSNAHPPSVNYLLRVMGDASIQHHREYTYTYDVQLLLSGQLRVRWQGLVNVVGVTQWPNLDVREISRQVHHAIAELTNYLY